MKWSAGKRAELARQRQHHGDLLVLLQREHVDDGLAARIARPPCGTSHTLSQYTRPRVGEAQDVVVRVGDEQLVDPVVFLGLRGLLAAAAAALRAVLGQRLALDVAGVRQRDDHVGRRDQVLGAEVAARCARCGCGARPAWSCRTPAFSASSSSPMMVVTRSGLARMSSRSAISRHDFLVLADDLVLLQAGQALQAHLQDFLRLVVGQAIEAVGLQAVVVGQAVGAERVAAARRCRPRRARASRAPATSPSSRAISARLGDRRRRRCLDQSR